MSQARNVDAVVVGAGFAGLYALHRLRALGLNVQVFEAGSDVGGTWFWNRYPGARCDVDSHDYSYSFSEDLQQEWRWPERFSNQSEILRYIHHVADRFGLRSGVKLDTRVTAMHYDEVSSRWTVRTDQGDEVSARFCVMASGQLSLPSVPDFPGLESFKGKWYHSGKWPHETVDFTGQRVGVIGTGSSGIQIIPLVAQEAKHLHVFQRTANYCIPAMNRPLTDEADQERKGNYKAMREVAAASAFCMTAGAPPLKSALEDTPEQREKVYESKWNAGGSINFLYAYRNLLVDKAGNDTAGDFVRAKIRSVVKDPKVAEQLAPKGYYIGTKRLCLGTNYYETYNRANVTLVDVRSSPIERITPTGVKTRDAEYALDTLVFATGFDAMTGPMLDIDIRGRDGLALSKKWADGPRSFLGLMTAQFPNLFIITGPGSPSVKTNMVCHIEQHVDWITDCIGHLVQAGIGTIETPRDKEDAWVQHVNEVADATLYPLADSWYTGANIPGKPRVFMPYVGGLDKYKALCDRETETRYQSFVLS